MRHIGQAGHFELEGEVILFRCNICSLFLQRQHEECHLFINNSNVQRSEDECCLS